MNPDLEEIDKRMAAAILTWLEDPESATPAQVEAARKYLAASGYSSGSHKKIAEESEEPDPRADLSKIPQHVLDQFT